MPSCRCNGMNPDCCFCCGTGTISGKPTVNPTVPAVEGRRISRHLRIAQAVSSRKASSSAHPLCCCLICRQTVQGERLSWHQWTAHRIKRANPVKGGTARVRGISGPLGAFRVGEIVYHTQSGGFGKVLKRGRWFFEVAFVGGGGLQACAYEPALFTGEVPREQIEALRTLSLPANRWRLKEGAPIDHQLYGLGTVLESSPNILNVKFVDGSTRSLDRYGQADRFMDVLTGSLELAQEYIALGPTRPRLLQRVAADVLDGGRSPIPDASNPLALPIPNTHKDFATSTARTAGRSRKRPRRAKTQCPHCGVWVSVKNIKSHIKKAHLQVTLTPASKKAHRCTNCGRVIIAGEAEFCSTKCRKTFTDKRHPFRVVRSLLQGGLCNGR